MERYNKTKAERRELIFKMDYILLMFLTEKNLLEKFIDNCRPITAYSDFNTTDILTAFFLEVTLGSLIYGEKLIRNILYIGIKFKQE